MFTKLWVIINCYSQYFKWVIFPYYISTNFGPYLLKFETWHKQMTLKRVHFHVIVLEPIYSDIGISFQLLNFPFKTKSKFLLQMKGVLSSAKLQTLQSRKKNKSFKYMLKINGSRTDPCGIPWISSFQELSYELILVLCQRFDK